MKKILVIYYTQTGQLKMIADHLLKPIKDLPGIEITFEQIKPIHDYPFPWGKEFFKCFPESVKGIPCELKPLNFDPEIKWDLIIIAFQSWFLSPSIPISSFLNTKEASALLKNRRVLTLHGVRNMWTTSQEIVKKNLSQLGADLVGNVVLADKTNNYIAGITTIRWLVNGKKDHSWILPAAGVSSEDIENSSVFGKIIGEAVTNGQFGDLQKKLVQAGGVNVIYHLVSIESTARKIFNKFADYVLKKGEAGDILRDTRIRLFKWYLLFVFFIVSPVATIFYIIKGFLMFREKRQIVSYYKGVRLKK
jgi:hypothetical protein